MRRPGLGPASIGTRASSSVFGLPGHDAVTSQVRPKYYSWLDRAACLRPHPHGSKVALPFLSPNALLHSLHLAGRPPCTRNLPLTLSNIHILTEVETGEGRAAGADRRQARRKDATQDPIRAPVRAPRPAPTKKSTQQLHVRSCTPRGRAGRAHERHGDDGVVRRERRRRPRPRHEPLRNAVPPSLSLWKETSRCGSPSRAATANMHRPPLCSDYHGSEPAGNGVTVGDRENSKAIRRGKRKRSNGTRREGRKRSKGAAASQKSKLEANSSFQSGKLSMVLNGIMHSALRGALRSKRSLARRTSSSRSCTLE